MNSLVVKANKSFSDGNFLKELICKILQCFGDEGKVFSNEIKNMSLSRKTVSRRADQIGIQIYKKITDKLEQCNFFSMALDESTDTTDISQLLIMIRTIDIEYNISEEMFHCVPMYGTTKGVDIHMPVANVFKDVVSFDKLSAVCTDGAPAMRGEKNGFAGLLKANGVSVPAFHCIIHQHALSAKAGIIKETLNIAVSMVNKIKGGIMP